MSTYHAEAHIIHSPEEAETLASAGLPHVTTELTCASCAAPIGCVGGKFVPTAIMLNDEHEWTLCMACVAPAVWPRN